MTDKFVAPFLLVLLFILGVVFGKVVESVAPHPTEKQQAPIVAITVQQEQTLPTVPEQPSISAPVSLSSAIFPIVILKENEGKTIAAAQGTGFLVGEKQRLVATAFHVPEYVLGKKGYTLAALVDGKTCELTLFWKHKTADIALLRPTCASGMPLHISTLRLGNNTPALNTNVTVSGYLSPDATPGKGCEGIAKSIFCPKSVTLSVSMVNAPMSKISIPEAIDQLGQYIEAKKKDPRLQYDDLFYSRLLVAETPLGVMIDNGLSGMSGSPLIDHVTGDVIAVFTSGNSGRFVFVPTREFPSDTLRGRNR